MVVTLMGGLLLTGCDNNSGMTTPPSTNMPPPSTNVPAHWRGIGF